MLINNETIPHINALIVLGRGIDANGNLSPTGELRARVAAEIADFSGGFMPIVFCGGRSWVQSRDGVRPPSEGAAMRQLAIDYMNPAIRTDKLFAEEISESTIENLVNARKYLKLSIYSRVGLLTDDLHWRYGRPQQAARLVMPDTTVVPMRIPDSEPPTKAAILEEAATTAITAIWMTGVEHGNDDTVMGRQELLEAWNVKARNTVEAVAARPMALLQRFAGRLAA